MPEDPQDEKWQLPDALRVDLDTSASKALLEQAEAKQEEWRAEYGQPFLRLTPRQKHRQRALILVEEYGLVGPENLTPEQRDEYAEALATLGKFGNAIAVCSSPERAAMWADIGRAIVQPDDGDCGHGIRRQVAEAEVFSLRHNADVVVMRCTECGFMNAKPAPDFLVNARARRQEIRAKYTGLTPLEAKERMVADGVI